MLREVDAAPRVLPGNGLAELSLDEHAPIPDKLGQDILVGIGRYGYKKVDSGSTVASLATRVKGALEVFWELRTLGQYVRPLACDRASKLADCGMPRQRATTQVPPGTRLLTLNASTVDGQSLP